MSIIDTSHCTWGPAVLAPYTISVFYSVLIKLSIRLHQSHLAHWIMNLVSKEILISIATVNPCQVQVVLLSNIAVYVEPDRGHSYAPVLLCFKFEYKNTIRHLMLDTFVCEFSLFTQNVYPFVHVPKVCIWFNQTDARTKRRYMLNILCEYKESRL